MPGATPSVSRSSIARSYASICRVSTMAQQLPKLEAFRTQDAHLVPADYPDGDANHRLPIGDALYAVWILSEARLLSCRRYGVSELMHRLGGDEQMSELGPLGFVERWKVNQVTLYYWKETLDFMLQTNPGMAEADLAPARAWATNRRSTFYWYVGASTEGALLYDAFADMLFVVKGLMSSIPHLLEQNIGASHEGAPPLLKRRVEIHGLNGRPELNGQKALAMHYDESAGRYAAILEQTGECVRIKPSNLQLASLADAGREAPKLLFLTLLPFEGRIMYDGVINAPDTDKPWNASFARAWTDGPGQSWAADVNDKVSELRAREPIRTLSPSHALLHHTRWRGGAEIHLGSSLPPSIRGQTVCMPGELDFVPPEAMGPTSATPEEANESQWWNGD